MQHIRYRYAIGSPLKRGLSEMVQYSHPSTSNNWNRNSITNCTNQSEVKSLPSTFPINRCYKQFTRAKLNPPNSPL